VLPHYKYINTLPEATSTVNIKKSRGSQVPVSLTSLYQQEINMKMIIVQQKSLLGRICLKSADRNKINTDIK